MIQSIRFFLFNFLNSNGKILSQPSLNSSTSFHSTIIKADTPELKRWRRNITIMYGLLQRWSRKEIIGIIVIGIIAIISFAFPHFIFSNTTFLSQHNNNPVTIWVKSEEFANENIWVVLSKGPEKAEHGLPVKEGHPPIDAKVGSDNYVITVFGGEEMSFNSSDTERTPKVSFDVEIPNMWSFYYTGYGKVNFIVDLDRENIEKKLFPLGR